MNFSLLLSKLGISQQLSQDITLLLFVALLSFVYGMLLGKKKIMTVLINIYVSFALISVLPEDLIADHGNRAILFLVLVAVMTIAGKKFFDISMSGSGSYFLLRVFIMSFLQVCLVLNIIFSMLPRRVALEYISSDAYGYLTLGWAPLVWMALPLVFMFFAYKRFNR